MRITASAIEAIARDLMAELGAGYVESIYRNALHKELVRLDPNAVMEQSAAIVFRGQYLGVCRADIVTTEFVIEVKALKTVPSGVEHQIRKYLKHFAEAEPLLRPRTGLVLNFNQCTETVDALQFASGAKLP
jgi:GxxExxY protein